MRRKLLYISVAILGIGTGMALGFYYNQQPKNSTGGFQLNQSAGFPDNTNEEIIQTPRPDFSLPDLNGHLRHVREWNGQVIALNFWATWCAPCLKEIPEFIELQNKYTDQGLQFIGIALQQAEEVKEFVQTQGMNYPVLVGEQDVIHLAEKYGNHIGALPYTVIIDRTGIIAFVKYGQLSQEVAEDVIISLL